MAEQYGKRRRGYNHVRTEECSQTPFYLPHWGGNTKPKTRRRRCRTHFPLDPRKHPVSTLHEYCSMQSIQPSFQFYEIPQKCGIEYGCIAVVENFQGKGRSFSKKIAKHQAAHNLLRKLSQPDYLGEEQEHGPRRFVSETGIVVVHYGETPMKQSCFRNRRRMTTPIHLQKAKRVKWQDSDGEMEDESHISPSKDDIVEFSNNQIELAQNNEARGGNNNNECTEENSNCQIDDKAKNKNSELVKKFSEVKIDTEIDTDDEGNNIESEGRFKSSLVETRIKTSLLKEENQDVMNEISEYLSERLQSASIEEVKEDQGVQEDYSSDEVKVVELNDVKINKRKKKKRSHSPMMDGTLILSRKSCLKEVNPIGYLQEACVHFNCNPPSYKFYRGDSQGIKSVCSLFDITTEGLAKTLKEAKRLSAVAMICQLKW